MRHKPLTNLHCDDILTMYFKIGHTQIIVILVEVLVVNLVDVMMQKSTLCKQF